MIKYRGHIYREAGVREARTVHDITPEYLQRLKKDDWVRVYHGTSLDFGAKDMVFGIDALEMRRNYEHPTRRDTFRPRGLFVAPTLKEAQRFGSTVFELAVRIRNLHPTDFQSNILRHWERGEGGQHTNKSTEDLKARCGAEYPDSDRPVLSAALDPSAKKKGCAYEFRKTEPQALFVGIIPAKDILAVHYEGQSYNPKEFAEEFLSDRLHYEPHPKLDPKSTQLSWKDYEELILPHFNSMDAFAHALFDEIERVDEQHALAELRRIIPFSRASEQKLLRLLRERYPRRFASIRCALTPQHEREIECV